MPRALCGLSQEAISADISAVDGFAQLLAIGSESCVAFVTSGNRDRRDNNMTYYRVEFLAAEAGRPAKKFLTPEKARKHARRVLGLADDNGLAAKVAIVAISKDGTPI
jgi:hypothetical protein